MTAPLRPPSRPAAILLTLLASLLWGSSFVVNKLGLDGGLDPVMFTLLRMILAAAITTALVARTPRRALRWFLDWRILVLGLSNAGGFLFQYLGQGQTSSSHAALLANAGLPLVVFLGWWLLRENLDPLRLVSVVLTLVGALLIALWRAPGGGEASLRGDVLVGLSSATWAIFIVLNRRLMQERPGELLPMTAAMYLWTVLTTLPVAASRGFPLPERPAGWLAVAYTGVFCSVIPYLSWSHGLKTITAAASSVLLTLEIVFAVLLSMAILGESLGWGAVAGGVLILLGAALVSRAPCPAKAPAGRSTFSALTGRRAS
ncbi:MAG: EamA family transporter [Myxococcales bacterium]|nr:EamA family transporter [Myxococcales bacterium]